MQKETPSSDSKETSPAADWETLKQIAKEWWIMQLLAQREAIKKGVAEQLPIERTKLPKEPQLIWDSPAQKPVLDASFTEASQFTPSRELVKFLYKNQTGSSLKQRIISWIAGAGMTQERCEQFLDEAINNALGNFFNAIKRDAKFKDDQEYPLSQKQIDILRGGIHYRLGSIRDFPEGAALVDMIMREFLDSLKKGDILAAYNNDFETFFWFQDETVYIKHVPYKFDLKNSSVRKVKQL